MGDNQLDKGGQMTPDARLTAAERAALADLEANATAADPFFAARLRGAPAARLRRCVAAIDSVARPAWAVLLAAGLWGLVAVVAGAALMVVGVATVMPVAVAGGGVAVVGLRIVAEWIDRRTTRRRSGPRR